MPWPSLRRVGEVLHHGHEAEHGADDAERRRVDAHAFENFRGARVGLLAHVQVHFENGADRVRLAAVDHELQPAFTKWSVSRSISGSRPSKPCLRAMLLHSTIFLMSASASSGGGLKIHGSDAHRVLDHRQRRLHEDRGDGADDDDHERGRRQQRLDARALEHGADQHRDQREHEADELSGYP